MEFDPRPLGGKGEGNRRWQARYEGLGENPRHDSLTNKAFQDEIAKEKKPNEGRLEERERTVAHNFNLEENTVRAQASLKMMGYDLGNTGYLKDGVDGDLNAPTTDAITKFQRAAGLEPTGKLDKATMLTMDFAVEHGLMKQEIEATGRRASSHGIPEAEAAMHNLGNENRVANRDELARQAMEANKEGGNPSLMQAQASLSMAGYDLGPHGVNGVDGRMGRKTREAMQEFQRAHGLKVTNDLSPKTMQALTKATAEGWMREAAPTAEERINAKRQILEPIHYAKSYNFVESRTMPKYQPNVFVTQLKDSQHKLEAIGFDLGSAGADGKTGPSTVRAIRDFQRTFGIPETGALDKATSDRIEKEYKMGTEVEKLGVKLSDGWSMPGVMKFGGSSEQEKYMTEKLTTLNKKAGRMAERYIEWATEQGKLDKYPEYNTVEKVKHALEWNQEKIDTVWKVSSQIKKEYGVTVDPRLMLSIIMQEGTLSFNTNADVKAGDGGHGIQPNFEKDLMAAMKQHVLGKLLAYGHYGKEFESTAVKDKDKRMGSYGGDIFQYINFNVPLADVRRNTVWSGVYAGHSRWCDNVRVNYEKLSYAGASKGYSDYAQDNNSNLKVKWPDVKFEVTANGRDHLNKQDQSTVIESSNE